MGGAIWYLSDEILKIANCTFSKNNSANFGSALQLNGTAYISDCTIADNECIGNLGGAIRSGTAEKTQLKNCIISNNLCSNADIGNVSAEYKDGGGNYQWPYSATHKKAVPGITFTDPMLGSLVDNGGGVLVRKPSVESIVIDGGTDVQSMKTDQCGNLRKNRCDAGAVENIE